MTDGQKKEYLEFAKLLALDAGVIMKKYFMSTDTTWKSDNTPVTQADTEINSVVINRITEAYPGHSVLGEEESSNLGKQFTWVCDPVDGTMPYSHGLPISTFSLALCKDGLPVVGVVYDPFLKRLFYASLGGGAYCNDEKIHVNANGLRNALIDIAGAQDTQRGVIDGRRIMEQLDDKGAKTSAIYSTVLPSCLIATGDYSATIFNLPKPEDPAAIKVIVEEAGGLVTDLFGNDQRYDQPTKGFIASNGVIHDDLVNLMKESTNEV